jgi:hypothetical protein
VYLICYVRNHGGLQVKDALDPARLETIRAAAAHVVREMVALDPLRLGMLSFGMPSV